MIKLENIVKDYVNKEQTTNALRGVDLTIEKGEFVAIVGTSGSGKTTLLNIIGGMDNATSGRYFFNGEELDNSNLKAMHKFRKKNISFVFQNFALMDKYTVYENVEMPLIARGIKGRKAIVMEKLEAMGIADLKNKLPSQLSGGQQQRCAIARALAADTPVLLADEPTGALDVKTGNDIINCFEEINKAGKNVIIITHDINIANRCNRIIKIEDGKIIG